MRIFYVLFVTSEPLRQCLEAIRFLSDPLVKERAHITVRGPYQKKISVNGINKRLLGNRVVLDRVGNYFSFGQKAVFLGCTSPKLRQVWYKPDFPFDPHITIYDGDSLEFAKDLHSVVSQYRYHIEFKADQLELLISWRGQRGLRGCFTFDAARISHIVNERIEPEKIQAKSHLYRLRLIDRICSHLSNFPSVNEPAVTYQYSLMSPKLNRESSRRDTINERSFGRKL